MKEFWRSEFGEEDCGVPNEDEFKDSSAVGKKYWLKSG